MSDRTCLIRIIIVPGSLDRLCRLDHLQPDREQLVSAGERVSDAEDTD
jgi:hypothetical protein